jgi:hypothetical protein
MVKEDVIKELLSNFSKHVIISLSFEKSKVNISSTFLKKYKYKNINLQNTKMKGYLEVPVKCSYVCNQGICQVMCNFSISKIHDIETIEEAVYYNTKKVLEFFIEDV